MQAGDEVRVLTMDDRGATVLAPALVVEDEGYDRVLVRDGAGREWFTSRDYVEEGTCARHGCDGPRVHRGLCPGCSAELLGGADPLPTVTDWQYTGRPDAPLRVWIDGEAREVRWADGLVFDCAAPQVERVWYSAWTTEDGVTFTHGPSGITWQAVRRTDGTVTVVAPDGARRVLLVPEDVSL